MTETIQFIVGIILVMLIVATTSYPAATAEWLNLVLHNLIIHPLRLLPFVGEPLHAWHARFWTDLAIERFVEQTPTGTLFLRIPHIVRATQWNPTQNTDVLNALDALNALNVSLSDIDPQSILRVWQEDVGTTRALPEWGKIPKGAWVIFDPTTHRMWWVEEDCFGDKYIEITGAPE